MRDVESPAPEHFVDEWVFKGVLVMQGREVDEFSDVSHGNVLVEIEVVDVRGQDAVEHAQDRVGKGVCAGGGVAHDVENVESVVQARKRVVAEPATEHVAYGDEIEPFPFRESC